MESDKTYSREEVGKIVDQMAKTLARLYFFLAREIVDEYGEDAKKVIERGVYKYGESRGKDIREQVLAANKPLTVANLNEYYDLPLHLAWISTDKKDENYTEKRVTYCPFASQWQELNGEDLGKIYCLQDLSLRKGFNPSFEFCQYTNILDGQEDCHSILRGSTQSDDLDTPSD